MLKNFLFFLSLFLCSCHVGEEYQPQSFITDEQVQSILKLEPTKDTPCSHWVDIFNDKDLNTLLSFAITSNFDLRQGKERLLQARYALLINSVQDLPMFDVTGNYTFSKINNPHQLAMDSNIFKVGFDASWEIDIWGKNYYISEQYLELANKAKYSLNYLQISICAELISNYINYKKNLELLHIAQKNIQLQTEILETVQAKYHSGLADDLALNQAQQIVTQTKSAIPDIELEIEKYKNALSILLGVTPDNIPVNLKNRKNNLTARTFKYSVSNLYNLPLDIVRTRPDIMAAEATLRQQNATLNEAIASLYPNITLSASFAYAAASGRRLINKDNQYYSYSPDLLQPLWHWNQLKNNIELQKHIKEEYLLQYNEALLTALTEIKNAMQMVEKAYEKNKYKKQSLVKMKNIMDITYEKYKTGLVDFTDVALSQQNFLTSQNDVVLSNTDILLSIITFYKAIGGYPIK